MTVIRLHIAIAMLQAARWLHFAAYGLTDVSAGIIAKAEKLQRKAHKA